MDKNGRQWARWAAPALADAAAAVVSLGGAALFRWGGQVPPSQRLLLVWATLALIAIHVAFQGLGRQYRLLWPFLGVVDAVRAAGLAALAAGVVTAMALVSGGTLPKGVIAASAVPLVLLTTLARLVSGLPGLPRPGRRAVVVGSGPAGAAGVAWARRSGLRPVALLDDEPDHRGAVVEGVTVAGQIADMPRLCQKLRADRVVWAPDGAGNDERRRILTLAAASERPLILLPGERPEAVRLTVDDVAALMGRDEALPATAEAGRLLEGRRVLVVGAGALATELCRRAAALKPRQIVVLTRDGSAAAGLTAELGRLYGEECPVRAVPGSAEDAERVEEVFSAFRPDVVFFAGGLWQTSLAEQYPREAVAANVQGTLTAARAALRAGAGHFVLASSAWAGSAHNVLAATWRLAERIVLALNGGETLFAALRLPGVLGAQGSVVPLFLRQIEAGGPVTVTHPDATRSFVTLPEAARLLIESGALAHRWSLFRAEGGGPVSIDALARTCIRLSGYEPETDIALSYIGLRPGEALHDDPGDLDDPPLESGLSGLMVCPAPQEDGMWLLRQVDLLLARLVQEPGRAREALARLVPGLMADVDNSGP